MNIIILTTKRSIYAGHILRHLLDREFSFTAFVYSSSFLNKKSNMASALKIIQDSGLHYFISRVLEQRYLKKAAHDTNRYPTPAFLAEKYSIPIYTTMNINGADIIRQLQSLNADLVLSMYFPQIIGKKIRELTRLGCINIHRAPLPKYRGPSSAFWQLAEGESQSGTTVHYIEKGIDSGPILGQACYPIMPDDTHHTLCMRAAEHGAELLADILPQLENGSIREQPQDEDAATTFSFPTKTAVRKFFQQGRKFY